MTRYLFFTGNVVLAVSAIPNGTNEPIAGLCLFGLLLIAIGTGGIKPNVSSFGGDQFLPTQVKEIAAFFSMFYFCINAGSVASMLITPYIMDMSWYSSSVFTNRKHALMVETKALVANAFLVHLVYLRY